MNLPHIKNTVVIRETNMTYHVMAYRTLTDAEIKMTLTVYFSQKGKDLERNGLVTIHSAIGNSGS